MKNIIKYLRPRICKVIAYDFNSKGTGFFINSEGLLLTNFHVVSVIQQGGQVNIASNIEIEFNGKKIKGKVENITQDSIKRYFDYDYCFIKLIDYQEKTDHFEFGSYDSLSEGEDVYFAGFPLTLNNPAYHRGHISSLRETNVQTEIGLMKVIDIDATVVKGNSGGPLIVKNNDNYFVIGIISSEVAVITKEFKNLQNFLKTQLTNPNSGSVFIAGVNPNAALLELINTIENNISTGIGTAISTDYPKQDSFLKKTTSPPPTKTE